MCFGKGLQIVILAFGPCAAMIESAEIYSAVRRAKCEERKIQGLPYDMVRRHLPVDGPPEAVFDRHLAAATVRQDNGIG